VTFKNQINQSTVSRMLYPLRLLVEIPIEYLGILKYYPCARDTKQYLYLHICPNSIRCPGPEPMLL